jgi:hypothetical protein
MEGVLTESKNGNPMVVVQFQFLDPPHTEIRWNGMLMGKMLDRTLDSLRYCGWTGDDLSNIVFPPGAEVSLALENELYEGKQHTKVKWVDRAGGAGVAKIKDQLSPIERTDLASTLKGAVLAHQQKQAAAGGDDSKIPF